jgi:plasmid maintenance system antidote protein VapI
MRDSSPANNFDHHPNQMLLDTLLAHLHLEDDSALAHSLKVAPYIVTMLREGRLAISPSMLLWMHDATGVSLQELQDLLGGAHAG